MSRLRIDVFSPPYHGHLHPALGLARLLRRHADIRVLTTPDATGKATAEGLEARPILGGHVADVWSIANTAGPVHGRPWMVWRQFRLNLRLMEILRAEVAAAWRDRRPDLVVADFTLPCVGHWALAQGLCWWTSHPSPLAIESRDGVPSYLGGWRPRDNPWGRFRNACGRRGVRAFKRALFALHGRPLRRLGLPGVYRPDGSEQAYSHEAILALTWKELEFPQTWPQAVTFLGPMFHTPESVGTADAPAFDPRRKNVLVTLGTHLPYARGKMMATLRRWAGELPEAFLHYTTGGDAGGTGTEGGNWRTYPYLSYERELERFDAIIHHGGAGITHYALRAGLPSVVWPQDYDQFDFAARLEHAGLARRGRRAGDIPRLLSELLVDETGRPRRLTAAQALRRPDGQSTLDELLRRSGLIRHVSY